MEAVLFNSYGSADVLEPTTIPIPLPGKGMVRIKVAAAGINPADLKWRSGMFREAVPVPMPHVLGYDIAGIVDELGAGVTEFMIGDRVCTMLDPAIKGGYAAFAVADAINLARVPDEMELDVAATLPTPGLAGTQLIREHVCPKPGEFVLVTGAIGAVGRFAMQAVIRKGANVIAAVLDGQQETAIALGASRAFVLGHDPGFDLHFDHVADVIGGDDVATLCRRLGPGGRIRTLATTLIDPIDLQSAPVFVAVRPSGTILSDVCEMVLRNQVSPVPPTIMPLSAAPQAHRDLENGNLRGKVVLHPW